MATQTKDHNIQVTANFATHRHICFIFLNIKCTTQKIEIKTKNIVQSYKVIDIFCEYFSIFDVFITIISESKNAVDDEHSQKNNFCDNHPLLPFRFENVICFVANTADQK